MLRRNLNTGVTLIELMITVAIIGIVAAISLPLYTDYIDTSRRGVMRDNIQTIRIMQEARRIEFGEYVEGNWDNALPGIDTTLETNLGWNPGGSDDTLYTYDVDYATDAPGPSPAATRGECTRPSGYTVTAVHVDSATQEVMSFTP